MIGSFREREGGQVHDRARSLAVFAIDEVNFATVGAGNLLRERKTDATPRRFGGVERNKKIFRIRNAQAAVFNVDDEV